MEIALVLVFVIGSLLVFGAISTIVVLSAWPRRLPCPKELPIFYVKADGSTVHLPPWSSTEDFARICRENGLDPGEVGHKVAMREAHDRT